MKKVRFGVVGTNFITDWLINGAQQDSRFELTAVCSRTEERADEFASKHGIPLRFTSLEEMAECGSVDAVYIATPNFLHARQAILCMSKGKHVLCEKPLASNAREAMAMVDAARTHGVTLMEAMKPTLTPNFLSAAHNLWRVGKVRRYFSAYCQYSSRYDAFKDGRHVNAFDPAVSNGAIMDIGIYTIYPMVVLFGKPLFIKASATLLPSGADGQGSALFGYDGMEAAVVYSKIADSSLPTEIQGEEGTIMLNRINKIENVAFTPRAHNAGGGAGMRPITEDLTQPIGKDEYYYEVAEFIDLVLAGKAESCVNSLANSVTTLDIIDEIRRQTGVVFPADGV